MSTALVAAGIACLVAVAVGLIAMSSDDQRSPCRLGEFGVDAWPGDCWRPYSASSPFNRPLPTSPRVHPDSDRIVGRLTGFGAPERIAAGDPSYDWSHPIYWSKRDDPIFTLDCVEPWGDGGRPVCPSLEGRRVRIPDDAKPAGEEDPDDPYRYDNHMTVVDQASGLEYDLWNVRDKPKGGGRLTFSWGGLTRIDGEGLGSGSTAAEFGSVAGVIRAQELEAGEIDHALFAVVRCDSGEHVYPATKSGRSCADLGRANEGAPPMGARLQLAMSAAEIEALDVPGWKRTILRALARYGAYVGDTGTGSWGVMAESGATYTSFGREDRLVEFAKDNDLRTGDDDDDGDEEHIFDINGDVNWRSRLRVIHPCESRGSC